MKNQIITSFVIIGLVALFIALNDASAQPSRSSAPAGPDLVTLHPAPGNNIVQMFGSISSDQAPVIKTFADGARCIKLSGPTKATVPGTSMHFYRLSCSGVTGYVNVKWVR